MIRKSKSSIGFNRPYGRLDQKDDDTRPKNKIHCQQGKEKYEQL